MPFLGICVMTDHNPRRKDRFEIHSLSNTNSDTHVIVRDGIALTIREYYAQRYDFQIKWAFMIFNPTK